MVFNTMKRACPTGIRIFDQTGRRPYRGGVPVESEKPELKALANARRYDRDQ
jgi:hypothetical protein